MKIISHFYVSESLECNFSYEQEQNHVFEITLKEKGWPIIVFP